MISINGLKPEKVFFYFNEISKIPHGSGNTEQINSYLLDFAKNKGLDAIKDKGGNVIIYCDATEGYENSEPVIIQGHMDMVCEKNENSDKDMEKEGLDLITDGEFLWADGTTLGGDDGIAVSYILALLDSDDIPHPPIEAVITRDEETGMYGAEDFDASLVKGKKILNIDSEEEGILTVSCAGGITAHCEIPLKKNSETCRFAYELSVSGLLGGHSGIDIGKSRKNAFRLLGELLSEVPDCRISAVIGGGKINVIPNSASVVIGTKTDSSEVLSQLIERYNKVAETYSADPDIVYSVKEYNSDALFFDAENTEIIIKFLKDTPTGAIKFSENIENLVESSLNMGVVNLSDECLISEFLIRSNNKDGKYEVTKMLESAVTHLGGNISTSADYPSWKYREISPIRDLMSDIYNEMFGKRPVISGIHAGLECGFFAEKIDDADIVSFGPNINNIHTPNEKLDIKSAERTWEYLKEILKRSK